jgi:hypothetical protein
MTSKADGAHGAHELAHPPRLLRGHTILHRQGLVVMLADHGGASPRGVSAGPGRAIRG